MERIENVLRRIQELYYSRHEKTGIDIDLMLDYTRVMYADLLEWRKRFKEETPLTAPAVEASAPTPITETATTPETATTSEAPAAPVQTAPETTLAAEEAETPDTATAATEEDTPAETIAGTEKEEAEAEIVKEVLHNHPSAISFEPPAPQPTHTMEIEDVLIEEDPVVNTPVEDIVLPEVAPTPEPATPVTPVQPAQGPVLRKDIRGAIGINDKYLFLNELFANNKTDYEEALDQLRLFDTYEQAYAWLAAHPAQKNRWDDGDDTVQSFLALVKQYLSSR